MQQVEDIEIKWSENVKEAKQTYVGRNKSQMKIAILALEVCEISWGGSKNDSLYTLTRFGKESGINPKMISSWICVYKKSYEKLDPITRNTASYTQLAHTASRVSYDASEKHVNEIFKDVTDKSKDHTLLRYCSNIRSIAFLLNNKKFADEANIKTLKEILFYSKIITKCIIENHPNIKAEDSGLAALSQLKVLGSAAQALGIKRNSSGKIMVDDDGHSVPITPKDRDIIAYIKKKRGYVSPTEVQIHFKKGAKHGGSAWASRTFNKLLGLKLVERNKCGHYKWNSK